MNLTLTVDASGINLDGIQARLERVVPGVQAAMAGRFGEIVRSNFGASGIDRPEPWPVLSPAYARKVRRTYATLYVSGALYDAVKVDTDKARVSVSKDDVVYALAHQFGYPPNNLPRRAYFPIDALGNVTNFTTAEVMDTARRALKRELS